MEEGTEIIFAESDDLPPLDEALLFVGTCGAISEFRVGEYHDDEVNRSLCAVDLVLEEGDGDIDGAKESAAL